MNWTQHADNEQESKVGMMGLSIDVGVRESCFSKADSIVRGVIHGIETLQECITV